MKTWYLLAVFGWAAFAQSPLPSKVPADKVVAKVDGKDVTAGEVYAALSAMPPQFVQMYNQNPKYAIQQLFMMRYLAAEGEKLMLGERSPYKEQLEAERANVLASALLGYQQDHVAVPDEAIRKYYDDHKSDYQQVKIKAIVMRFKPVIDPNASVDERARVDVENRIFNIQRTEDEARQLATEVAEKLKGGADFAKLVLDYSDDTPSKAKGGDLGVVDVNSKHIDEIKQAVAKLKAGEISAPIRTANAIMIVRVDEKTLQSEDQVASAIAQDLRKVQLKAWFDDVTRRFQPTVEIPEFFTQPAPVPTLQPPPAIR
jgi:parvulin-like peptidyl-prolyl isomerase